MLEWSNRLDWKSSVGNTTGGSNPLPSANLKEKLTWERELGVIDYGYEEIKTAAEYNKRYNVELGPKSRDGKYKYKKVKHPNAIDIFYSRLTEEQKQRWAESYMDFKEYYKIYKK